RSYPKRQVSAERERRRCPGPDPGRRSEFFRLVAAERRQTQSAVEPNDLCEGIAGAERKDNAKSSGECDRASISTHSGTSENGSVSEGNTPSQKVPPSNPPTLQPSPNSRRLKIPIM